MSRRAAPTDVITDYAARVVKGELPAGKLHKLACKRHLSDLKRQGRKDFPYEFHIEHAELFFEFAQALKHYKGSLAGQCIRLEDWQKFAVGSVFAWTHKDTKLRRFRTAYNEIPRKNGKTTIAATVSLYVTFSTGEKGNEGYIVATKREQSKICFNDAKRMVESSPLKDVIDIKVGELNAIAGASKLMPLGADHNSTDGLNPGFVCVDEMHAMKDRGMLDVMETATGARDQPLIFQITTAGDDPLSPCGQQRDYAAKILEGLVTDDRFFAFIAHADEDDDWTTEETARKANPNYGISVKPDDMKSLVLKAQNIPSAAAAYQQKRLDRWLNATSPCLSLDGWRRGQSDWTPEDMRDQPCYVGIDLASKIDLAALSVLFPPTEERPTWRLLQHIWTPEDTLAERAHRDRAPYGVWAEQGWLTTSPGTRIDAQAVREAVIALRDTYGFDVERIGFDPWHSDQLITQLVNEDGFSESQVLAVPQTFAGMSSACLHLQAEILDGKVDARRCPVTAWAVSNVAGQRDGKDNLMFAKGKSRGRIDPVIAATIATALYLKQPAEASVYEGRGVLTL
jgi:phage terminase large subunit-like protein